MNNANKRAGLTGLLFLRSANVDPEATSFTGMFVHNETFCIFFAAHYMQLGPMVKRISSLASNEVFRVRVLVGLLEENDETEGQPDWRRDPVGSRLSDEP